VSTAVHAQDRPEARRFEIEVLKRWQRQLALPQSDVSVSRNAVPAGWQEIQKKSGWNAIRHTNARLYLS
jgi:hypothetical protein